MVLRELKHDDMKEAIELRGLCWPEELNNLSDNQVDYKRELDFWTRWMNLADENNDVRLLYGVFEHDKMLGVAFGSFVASKDMPEHGFELNGLWVYPNQRGKGVSLMLLKKLLDEFYDLDARKVIIYNMHHAPSNQYYRKFGCKVVGSDVQLKEALPVDIFSAEIDVMRAMVAESLQRYS